MPEVIIFTSRRCPYCVRALRLLESKNIPFTESSVDGKPELRNKLTELAGQHTVPQIWIGEFHVGGCTDLMALDRSGELDRLLGRQVAGA